MKTVTIDFNEYERELLDAKRHGATRTRVMLIGAICDLIDGKPQELVNFITDNALREAEVDKLFRIAKALGKRNLLDEEIATIAASNEKA